LTHIHLPSKFFLFNLRTLQAGLLQLDNEILIASAQVGLRIKKSDIFSASRRCYKEGRTAADISHARHAPTWSLQSEDTVYIRYRSD
jgi:hypothetical protein